MSHTRRTVFGRSRRQQKRGVSASRSRNRLSNIERLEDRVLLAADLNPWHNYDWPLDVNGDYRITAMDVLAAINGLKDGPVRLGDLLASSRGSGEAVGEAEANAMFRYQFDVNNDMVLSASDVIPMINALNSAEGEDLVKLVKAEGRVTQNIPPTGVTPVNRPVVSTVNVGETVLLNVFVEDIRLDDGIADPNSDQFGIFAAYFDVNYNPDAFQVPTGTGINPNKQFNFPISFVNPQHQQTFGSVLQNNFLSTDIFNFPNGPAGDLYRGDGLIDDAGGFSGLLKPIGRQLPQVPAASRHVFLNMHLYDVPFTAQSLYAKDDQVTVDAGSSVQFNVMANDGLVAGNYQFILDGADGIGREVLTFGDNGTTTGSTGQGSVVPEGNILFVNPTVNVPLAGRQLTFVGISVQPTKGTLVANGAGAFTYTPNVGVTGPTTDTFTYQISDGQGRTKNAVATITIEPVNAQPVITAPNAVTMDEGGVLAFTGTNAVTITDADGDPMNVVLTTNAPISVAAGSGVTFTDSDGTDGTLAFNGTQAQINAALAGLTYTPPTNFYGTPQLTIRAQDKLPDGSILSTVNRTVTITVRAINDPPTLVTPGNQTVQNIALPLVINSIRVADEIDAQFAPGGDVQGRLTLATTGGTLTVVNQGSLTITGNGGNNVVMTGLTAAINAAMAGGVQFTAPVGPHTITATMNDLGNVDYRGASAALEVSNSFQVTVVPPTRPFAVNDTVSALEDSQANVFTVLVNDFNFDSQTGGANLNITAVSDPPNGAVTITGGGTTLTYTPDPDFFGQDVFTYTVVDTTNAGDGPSTATVTVNVTGINDQPSFTASNPPTVNEDAGPQALPGWAVFDPGPANESGQAVLQYLVSNVSNPALFAAAPSVANNGTLTYTTAQDAWGTSTFTVRVQDNGGTANGGVDTSEPQTFIITVLSVNDPPTFTAADPPAVNEGAGAQTVPNWATDFNPGPPDEAGQTLVGYTVSNVSNPGLFAVLPAVDINGTLTYTLLDDDVFGTSTFVVRAQDDGGKDNGGIDLSVPRTFTLTVRPVNDPPTFTASNPPTVAEDAGPQTVANWAAFSPGPANESSQQVLGYTVSNISNPGLFAAPPSVANNGTLTYTSAPDAHGQSTFTVVVRDNGGTENGGIDTSAPQTFTIIVTPVNDAPVNRINGSPNFAANVQSTDDNTPLPFNAANGNLIQVTDVDDPAGTAETYTVILTVDLGTLDLGSGGAATQTLTGSLNQINAALTNLVYHPSVDSIDIATLTIESRDGGTFGAGPEGVDVDTLLIEVAPFNDPPIAKDDLIDTPEGTPVTFDPLADNGNGPDSAGPNEDGFQTIQVIAVDPVGTSGGTTAWNPSTGLVTYTPPNADFFGTDTFTYTIEDDGESMIDGVRQPDFKTAIGTVTVTVLARNDAPHAEDDLLLIPPLPQAGQQIVFPASALLGNDNPGPANESNQVLRILSVQMMAGTKGTIELLDKGTADPSDDEIRYTVPANFDHMDTFMYTVQDNGTSQQRADGQLVNVADPKTATAMVTIRDVVLSTISGSVYFDSNGDGQRNDGEPGIAGVVIRLAGTDITGTPFVQETRTSESGRYEFSGLLPSQEGTVYTISQPQQPNAVQDGTTSAGNGGAVVTGKNEIQVHVPLTGFGDPANSVTDLNNFGELGLTAPFASISLRDLLHSEIGGNNSELSTGWVFATDAAGNLQWFTNIGGWEHYVPGRESATNPGTYQVQIVNGVLWITDHYAGVERQLAIPLSSSRLRQVTSGGQTITQIIGGADYFGLPSHDATAMMGGEGEADADLARLATTSAPEDYSDAVDAIFAASGDDLV
jgi:hypothetical protein